VWLRVWHARTIHLGAEWRKAAREKRPARGLRMGSRLAGVGLLANPIRPLDSMPMIERQARKDMSGLVELLSARASENAEWKISADELAESIGMAQVPFWRAVHAVRDRISFTDAIDGWTHESAGDLVTVLEGLLSGTPEDDLTRAGLFMPYKLGVALIEELHFRARRLAAGHEVREEELGAMIRHAGSVRAAIGIYLEAHVDLESLIDGCAESFRVLQGLPRLARATAARFLRGMFSRHVLDRRTLLAGLEERLRLAAATMGFVDPEDRVRRGGSERVEGGRISARRAWALRVMRLTRDAYTAEELRASYRTLMMRYHPDKDPSGLERCKDVNSAYAFLTGEAAPAN
jgi:hypothetical protein